MSRLLFKGEQEDERSSSWGSALRENSRSVVVGLLDSGASVSILGKGCRELIEKLFVKIDRYFSQISIAS